LLAVCLAASLGCGAPLELAEPLSRSAWRFPEPQGNDADGAHPLAATPCEPVPLALQLERARFARGSSARLASVERPAHALDDHLAPDGGATEVIARFAYGSPAVALEGEEVELWILPKRCAPWRRAGRSRTNAEGEVQFAVQASEVGGPGLYPMRAVVRADQTEASAFLLIAQRGQAAVVFDIDGTLTEPEPGVVQELLFPATEGRPQKGAATVARAWAARGFRVVYLTARPRPLRELTASWLARHGFPAGVLLCAPDLASSRQSDEGSAAYKRAALERLREAGVDVHSAYGNVEEDVDAYLAAGLPPERVFTLGPLGAYRGAHALGSYSRSHIERVRSPQ
jgi:hypothetical protein